MRYALGPYAVGSRYVICLHSHNVRLCDIPRGEVVIFAVREPISRFVSGFYSRKRQGMPKMFTPWIPDEREAFEYFSTPNQLAVAISSQNMEERDRAYRAMTCIGHVRSSYWDWFKSEEYFRSRLSDILFIGFQERLTEGFETLKSKLDIPENAQLPNDNILAHKNTEDGDKALTDEAVENLKKWYKDDFAFIALCEEVVREHPDICG